MAFIFKRRDDEYDMEGYITENDEYGVLSEAKVFDDRDEVEKVAENPPADETGDYDYTIIEI